jgi:hypothetical protein
VALAGAEGASRANEPAPLIVALGAAAGRPGRATRFTFDPNASVAPAPISTLADDSPPMTSVRDRIDSVSP